MWGSQEFRTKARIYFQRAENVHSDDEAVFLWCTLGLEFMLRAPLAEVHPALLAEPEGVSLLHACGFTDVGGGGEPKSVNITTVLKRLATVVPKFDSDHDKDAKMLIGLRNHELHSAGSLAADISGSAWIPSFIRLLDTLTDSFCEKPEDYFGEGFLDHAKHLVDKDEGRLVSTIQGRIGSCRKVYEGLTEEEREIRRSRITSPRTSWSFLVTCPACKESSRASYSVSRYGSESFIEDDEDGQFVRMVFLIADHFSCPVCALTLEGVREFAVAKLPQEQRSEVRESLYERLGMMDGPDYGND